MAASRPLSLLLLSLLPSSHPTILAAAAPPLLKLSLGGLAGCAGGLVVYPIDLIKTRLQSEAGKASYDNGGQVVARLLASEGPLGLYHGVSTQLVGVAPEKAIKLSVFSAVKNSAVWGGDAPLGGEVLAGLVAGLSQTVVTNPLEIVKVRMQLGGGSLKATTVIRELGLPGLYIGAGATALRDSLFSAILCARLPPSLTRLCLALPPLPAPYAPPSAPSSSQFTPPPRPPPQSPPPASLRHTLGPRLHPLLHPALSPSTVPSTLYPPPFHPSSPPLDTFIHTSPIRSSRSVLLAVPVNEHAKPLLASLGVENAFFCALLAGMLAAAPAAFLTTPADVIKTRVQEERKVALSAGSGMQLTSDLPNADVAPSVRSVARQILETDGLSTFFDGGLERVLRSSPQFGVTLATYDLLNSFCMSHGLLV